MEIVFPIAAICWIIFRKKPHEIKYDKRDRKVLGWLAVAFTVLKVGLEVLLFVNPVENFSVFMILFYAGILLGFLSFFEWVQYFDCIFYFKRLKRFGYQIPDRKSDYGGLLENLPSEENMITDKKNVVHDETNSKESIILAVICWGIAIIFLLMALWLWYRFGWIDGIIVICLAIYGIIILVWTGMGIFYWRQRRQDRYRDDVGGDESRKPRVQLVSGIAIILMLFFFTNMAGFVLNLYAEVVYNSKEQYYQEQQLENGYNEEN